jgi:hypothetical protein
MAKKIKSSIKARPLCERLGRVSREAAARAKQEGENPELAKHAAVIRTLGKRVTKDIIEIGRRLTEAKKLVGHDHWGDWLEKEFAWSEGTALNFMRVFKFAEERKNKNFTDLDIADLNIAPSALYALVRKSAPEEMVDEIMARAGAGEAITNSLVQEILAKHAAANKAEQPEQKESAPDQPEQTEGEPDQPEQTASQDEQPKQEEPEQPKQEKGEREQRPGLDADPRVQDYGVWFREAVKHANGLKRAAEIVDDQSLDEERRAALRKAIEPDLLDDVLVGGGAGVKLFNFLWQLVNGVDKPIENDQSDEPTQDDEGDEPTQLYEVRNNENSVERTPAT